MNRGTGPVGARETAALQPQAAWRLLLAARAAASAGRLAERCALGFDSDGMGRLVDPDTGDTPVGIEGAHWRGRVPVSEEAAQLFDLHLPLIRAGSRGGVTLAQLGQSLDGRIATHTGHSHYVTGSANRDHLHRLRALADAVVVGAGTVACDDPRLSVRRIEGRSPVRVVLDPRRRLPESCKVFTDEAAPTLLLCAAGSGGGDRHGAATVLRLAASDGGFDPAAVLHALHRRGLGTVLVEGGGVTVSRFLAASLLDRLHLAIAPLLIGSGRPGIVLPPVDDLDGALRPRVRFYPMGADMLVDCDLRGTA